MTTKTTESGFIFLLGPIKTPVGKYLLITAEISVEQLKNGEYPIHDNGRPKRQYITSEKFYKTEANAQKQKKKNF